MGAEILRDITFDIAPRSFQFLTGPSGAGKTTLLRLILLAMPPTRGLITLFGKDSAKLDKAAIHRPAAQGRGGFPGFPPARPSHHLPERRLALARAGARGGELSR